MLTFYYNIYAEKSPFSNTKRAEINYGIGKMIKLFHFLGYQKWDVNVNKLKKIVTHLKVPKNHILVEMGEVLESVHFIVSGAVIYIDGKGGVHSLLGSGNLIMDSNPYSISAPSKYSIKTAKKSIILSISKKEWLNFVLNGKNEDSKHFILNAIVLKTEFQERLINFLKLSSKDKVQLVPQEFPGLLESFTSRDIARFLGMQPETFSRVK